MIILLITILIISYKKGQGKISIYECIGALLIGCLPFNIQIKSYKTLRQLRFLNSKNEFIKRKKTYLNHKLSALTVSVFLAYYFVKMHNRISGIGWIYALAAIVFLICFPEYKLSEHVKKHKLIMKSKLPNFLLKLNLLMGSGMSTIGALKKISSSRKNCLENVISKVVLDIESGSSTEDSFHELTQQCQDVYITQFARIIVQDKKYGTKETISSLDTICGEVWKNKKVDVLKKGEEASTKLLVPMMIALISILAAVTVPAISQLFEIS